MKLLFSGFIVVFVVIGLSMAVLNGAGVIFGMAFVGMAVFLQMLYSILGELRATRLLTEQHLIAQTRVADNLEWLMFAPEGERAIDRVNK